LEGYAEKEPLVKPHNIIYKKRKILKIFIISFNKKNMEIEKTSEVKKKFQQK
jgi:hypothetical protein